MLYLTRRPLAGKDTIILTDEFGQRTKIVVTKVNGKNVGIGIDAPDNITILREEVPDRDQ